MASGKYTDIALSG